MYSFRSTDDRLQPIMLQDCYVLTEPPDDMNILPFLCAGMDNISYANDCNVTGSRSSADDVIETLCKEPFRKFSLLNKKIHLNVQI